MMPRTCRNWLHRGLKATLCYLGTISVAGLVAMPIAGAVEHRPVDVALVIAWDVSGSMSNDNYELQRSGTAAALRSTEVAKAVQHGPIGRIAVSVIQWSEQTAVSVDWTVVEDAGDLAKLADRVAGIERLSAGSTCMGQAMAVAVTLLDRSPEAVRRVIDMSGDGATNCLDGASLSATLAARPDITVNGLPIVTAVEPNVAEWYATRVVSGPGGFVEPAAGFVDVARAMTRKLILEIAQR